MKIGITGGIGSGKSFICKILKDKGFPVYNCDDEAKRLMVESKDIISSLKTLISDDAYLEQHSYDGKAYYMLNKPVIANYLFANPANAAHVNAIVHPIVKDDFMQWAARQESEYVFMECAILYESGFEDTVDKTVLIFADERNRLKRAMKRDHATEQQIRSRMSQQIDGKEACLRADYVFDHNNYDSTDEEIEKLLLWIKNNK